MYRTSELVAAGALLFACANGRIGMQTYPIGSTDSGSMVLLCHRIVLVKCHASVR
jgi:hypothetical protein